jgi:trehalose-6-phosphate synthase
MNISTEAVVALIMSGGALIGAVVTFVSSARKNEVSALSQIINQLRTRVEELEAINEDLENWAERLCCQVREVGKEPVKFIRRHNRKDGTSR